MVRQLSCRIIKSAANHSFNSISNYGCAPLCLAAKLCFVWATRLSTLGDHNKRKLQSTGIRSSVRYQNANDPRSGILDRGCTSSYRSTRFRGNFPNRFLIYALRSTVLLRGSLEKERDTRYNENRCPRPRRLACASRKAKMRNIKE